MHKGKMKVITTIDHHTQINILSDMHVHCYLTPITIFKNKTMSKPVKSVNGG